MADQATDAATDTAVERSRPLDRAMLAEAHALRRRLDEQYLNERKDQDRQEAVQVGVVTVDRPNVDFTVSAVAAPGERRWPQTRGARPWWKFWGRQ